VPSLAVVPGGRIALLLLAARERALGGKGSGNFGHKGRPGEVGGSAADNGLPQERASVVQKFNMQAIPAGAMHRIMINPENGKMILGRVFEDPGSNDAMDETHSGVYSDATGKVEGFDDYYRGYVMGARPSTPFGYIEIYDPATFEESLEDLTEDDNARVFDDLSKIFTHLAKNGGLHPKTRWAGALDAMLDQPVEVGEQFPFVFQKKRALGGPGSGNFNHKGRPGQVGGSSSDGGSARNIPLRYRVREKAAAKPARAKEAAPKATLKAAPKPKQPETITVYHNSPDVFEDNKPNFSAYFGDSDFLKSFPNEWGEHTYAIDLPTEKLLDLDKGSSDAREFMTIMATLAYPNDPGNPEFIEKLKAGDPEAVDDFYEAWTDKSFVTHALELMPKYEAVRFRSEFVVPHQTLAKLQGRKFKALGGPGSGNFGHAGRPGEVGGSASADVSIEFVSSATTPIEKTLEQLDMSEENVKSAITSMTRNFPGKWLIEVTPFGRNELSIEGTGIFPEDESAPSGSFSRVFSIDDENELFVVHSSFSLPESMQNQGHAKLMMRNALETYDKMGVSQIETHAVDVGAYAWARAGFLPEKPQAVARSMRTRINLLTDGGVITESDRSRLLVAAEGSRALWRIADDPQGRLILRGLSYDAKLNLKDSAAVRRARHYAGLES